jgi:hypothetical protein
LFRVLLWMELFSSFTSKMSIPGKNILLNVYLFILIAFLWSPWENLYTYIHIYIILFSSRDNFASFLFNVSDLYSFFFCLLWQSSRAMLDSSG